ncbi:MAG: BrnA antitoxin family protein [Acidobacteriota bacterium]|nr:BrnA antitoxin family protein [Acidobacteriota bacterium]
MKKKSISDNKEVILEVTQEQYDEQLASGLTDEEILRPGKHVFRRGGFQARHPNHSRKESKARINIYIDLDVLDHFRKRAEKPNSAPYQTQINAELRAVLERDLGKTASKIDATVKKLLENDEFLKALSEKLKEKELLSA